MIERQGQCHLCEGHRNSKTAVDVETNNTLQSREVYQKDSAEYGFLYQNTTCPPQLKLTSSDWMKTVESKGEKII